MKTLRPYQQQAVQECWNALKLNDNPVLLMASVGSGKSLMIASILSTMASKGKRALCLVNNAELVRNNCATLIDEGGKASIYCAALGSKDASAPVVFGTPQSVLNGINKNDELSRIKFNIIVVDEAHAINYLNHRSCFMRILRHYKTEYPGMRLLGATGTNFRFKGSAIVGPECLFKTQVGNINTERLINEGYLIKPTFEIDKNLILDFSNVKIKKNGQFDQKQLESVIENSARLTELICKQVVHVMESQNRCGVFFFATTKKHAYEILSHLPKHESAIILGETPQDERTTILEKARNGSIRYLVNIAIISVGVDVPSYDTIAYLRPTESLVLFVQTMGRVLRLSPNTNKDNALVLDFSGNILRFQDYDDPILLDAVKQTINEEADLIFPCPMCCTMNSQYARRCVGIINKNRCEFYFVWKDCTKCNEKNDITTRQCRECGQELIDPNNKLSLTNASSNSIEYSVIASRYWISELGKYTRVNAAYRITINGEAKHVSESYCPSASEKAKNFFYGRFVKHHCENSSFWYPHLTNPIYLKGMIQNINSPIKVTVTWDGEVLSLKKKIFQVPDIVQ